MGSSSHSPDPRSSEKVDGVARTQAPAPLTALGLSGKIRNLLASAGGCCIDDFVGPHESSVIGTVKEGVHIKCSALYL